MVEIWKAGLEVGFWGEGVRERVVYGDRCLGIDIQNVWCLLTLVIFQTNTHQVQTLLYTCVSLIPKITENDLAEK